MSDATWAALATIAGAAIVFFGERYRVRQSRKVSDAEVRVDAKRVSVESRQVDGELWQSILEQQRKVYEDHVSGLQEANKIVLDALREDLTEALKRIDKLEEGRAEDQRTITGLKDALEREEARSRTAVRYVREVLAWIRIHVPDGTPPTPPPDLLADI